MISMHHSTRGAVAPLFFCPVQSSFSKPGLVPDFKSGKCWRMLTPKIAKELNAQDRKKLQKKIKLERKRSQKLGQKKRGVCPFDFLDALIKDYLLPILHLHKFQ